MWNLSLHLSPCWFLICASLFLELEVSAVSWLLWCPLTSIKCILVFQRVLHIFLLSHRQNKSSDFLTFYLNSLASRDLVLISDSFGSLDDTKRESKNQWWCSQSIPLWVQQAVWFHLLLDLTDCEIMVLLFIGQMSSVLFSVVEYLHDKGRLGFQELPMEISLKYFIHLS